MSKHIHEYKYVVIRHGSKKYKKCSCGKFKGGKELPKISGKYGGLGILKFGKRSR